MSPAANTGCTYRNQLDTTTLFTFNQKIIPCVRNALRFISEFFIYTELFHFRIKFYYTLHFILIQCKSHKNLLKTIYHWRGLNYEDNNYVFDGLYFYSLHY